jgi:DNA-binding NtrC family response regulator
MTGCGSIPNAVEAIKLGAEHYLTKPVELAELSTLMERIMEMRKLRLENRYYQQLMDNPVVGVSMAIQKLHHMIDLMAENADTTVLLLGESGTGKELVAREIHRRSRRSERLFLDINCAVLSETLLESEMFGHERGAFTDAREFKRGLLEVADGGTVFLDEIGEMPLSVQPKLLRVLETHSFKRVGSTKDVHVNVRIIAATNKDLARAVAGGRFRDDLYYRLKVFPVHLPPLRERQEDVTALEDHFVKHFNAILKKNITGFTHAATDLLKNYTWPGNVRELKNVVERAMVLSKVTAIGADLLPREISGFQEHFVTGAHGAKSRSSDRRPLADMERDYIVEVFHHEKKNRTTTARVLGISRSTLQMKLKKYGIT